METMIKTTGLTRTFPLAGGSSITVLKGIDIEIPAQKMWNFPSVCPDTREIEKHVWRNA